VREKPAGSVVSAKVMPLAQDAGYVRISSFRNGVVEDLRKQIADVSRQGAKSLIIDLRRTAEGPLENGIAAARLFVKSGTLSIKAGRNGENKETVEAQPGDGTVAMPVQLLVTTGTSGPAELFAAALQDNNRGDLVGERTLGRAGVQKLVKLPESRGLWLTYAQYYRATSGAGKAPASGASASDLTPGGRPGTPAAARPTAPKIAGAEPISGKGLRPDVEVDDVDVAEFGLTPSDKDPILDAAMTRLKKKAA
jgi:carboxyl-terminal processing protease